MKNLNQMIDHLKTLAKDDYESYIKAIIALETGCEDHKKLNDLYNKFIYDDEMLLINEAFYE